mgnify:CR=1 FL=1
MIKLSWGGGYLYWLVYLYLMIHVVGKVQIIDMFFLYYVLYQYILILFSYLSIIQHNRSNIEKKIWPEYPDPDLPLWWKRYSTIQKVGYWTLHALFGPLSRKGQRLQQIFNYFRMHSTHTHTQISPLLANIAESCGTDRPFLPSAKSWGPIRPPP